MTSPLTEWWQAAIVIAIPLLGAWLGPVLLEVAWMRWRDRREAKLKGGE